MKKYKKSSQLLSAIRERLPQRKHAAHKPRRLKRRRLVPLLIMVAGVALLSYPVFATLIMNASQQRVVKALEENIQHEMAPAELEAKMAEADAYNESLFSGPILDPFLAEVAPDTPLYRAYEKILSFTDDGVMGSISIPKINVRLPIYHGTFSDALNKGVGHLFGTALPVGGKSTHSVLSAHSGLGTATMFDDLPALKKGDSIILKVGNRTLEYVVTGTQVVLPTRTDSLNPVPDKDLLTLITCTPYGINTHRLLVHAERVEPASKEAVAQAEKTGTVLRTWMIFPPAIILIIFVLIARMRKNTRPL